MAIKTILAGKALWLGTAMAVAVAGTAAGVTTEGGHSAAGAGPHVWTGTMHQTVYSDGGWVAVGYHADGDFAFTVGADGAVHGQASVAYQPTFDASKIDGLINYARDNVQALLDSVSLGDPILAPFLSVIRARLVGGAFDLLRVRGDYTEAMPVRTGAIAGQLRNGRLDLHWADDQKGLPLTVYIDALKGTDLVTHAIVPLRSPWSGTAAIGSADRLTQAVGRDDQESGDDAGKASQVTFWSARLVS